MNDTTVAGGLALYLSPDGNDNWSGRLAEPDPEGNDGPLATLEWAREMVRRMRESGDARGPITVWVRGGRYHLGQPVWFNGRDSGPTTYRGYPGETAVFTGGRRVTGWRVVTAAEVGIGAAGTSAAVSKREVWVADLDAVAAGSWYFRQLFVNGERRPRARLPKDGYFWMEDVPGFDLRASQNDEFIHGHDRFVAREGDVANWRNLSEVDVVVHHYWVEERLPIASFDEHTRLVTSSRRSIFVLRDDVGRRYAKYYAENVFEALSEPGEWYLDRSRGRLFYLPLPGESPDDVEIYAPAGEQLLLLRGTPDRPVDGVRFADLTFECCDWSQPGPGALEGFEAGDHMNRTDSYGATAQAACNLSGVIDMEYARRCGLEGCTLRNLGLYGVVLRRGCFDIRIVGNEIADLGAGGVRINGGGVESGMHDRTGRNVLTDNTIRAGGRVFPSAVGILIMHSFGNVVAHNHIHDLYYSGISCGWIWGYGDTVAHGNRIERNHIHDLGQGVLSDMGGIYTLGVQPGTVLRGNLIHDIHQANYGGWCIYLDEGSSHILVENNVCYRAGTQVFNQHYGRENIVRNNVFAYGGNSVISLGRAEDHVAFTLEQNLLLTRDRPVFARRPRGIAGARGFRSNLNLLWDVARADAGCGGDPIVAIVGTYDADGTWIEQSRDELDEWRAGGNDTHSIVADPHCADLEQNDFNLLPGAPALALGVQPIDLSDVGPRPIEDRS